MALRGEGGKPVYTVEKKEDPRDKLEGRDRDDFEEFQRVLNETAPAFEKLALSLRRDIEAGRWDSIIVDDTRGRQVGALLREIIKRHSRENDTPSPQFGFLDPHRGRFSINEKISEYIEEHLEEMGERVLLVTEYIASGKSIQSLRDAFEVNGVSVDVATLSHVADVEVEGNVRGKFRIRNRPKLYMGGSRVVPMVNPSGRGVKKAEGKIHAERDDNSGLLVTATRLEMKEFADRIYDEYFATDAPEKAGILR